MNEITVMPNEMEAKEISDYLERLHTLQGRMIKKEALAVFTKEVMETGFPHKAIISGIRSLGAENLSVIKLQTIITAVRGFIEEKPTVNNKCQACKQTGYVVMLDEEHRFYSLACQCRQGNIKVTAQGLKRWNGSNMQKGTHGTLTRA